MVGTGRDGSMDKIYICNVNQLLILLKQKRSVRTSQQLIQFKSFDFVLAATAQKSVGHAFANFNSHIVD